MPDRPPLGIPPRYIVDQKRASEIIEAIRRYNNAGIKIPEDWINELLLLIEKIR